MLPALLYCLLLIGYTSLQIYSQREEAETFGQEAASVPGEEEYLTLPRTEPRQRCLCPSL